MRNVGESCCTEFCGVTPNQRQRGGQHGERCQYEVCHECAAKDLPEPRRETIRPTKGEGKHRWLPRLAQVGRKLVDRRFLELQIFNRKRARSERPPVGPAQGPDAKNSHQQRKLHTQVQARQVISQVALEPVALGSRPQPGGLCVRPAGLVGRRTDKLVHETRQRRVEIGNRQILERIGRGGQRAQPTPTDAGRSLAVGIDMDDRYAGTRRKVEHVRRSPPPGRWPAVPHREQNVGLVEHGETDCLIGFAPSPLRLNLRVTRQFAFAGQRKH